MLTSVQVLREPLTGGGATVMIACISPAEADLRETIGTLRYADSVKKMRKPEGAFHLINTSRPLICLTAI